MTIKAAVFVGRFQPFHNGHFFTLKSLLANYDKVVVVIGSHNSLRSLKNPWTALERKEMILESLTPEERRKTQIIFQEDKPGQDAHWAQNVKAGVNLSLWDFHQEHTMFLSGTKKDESSFYLDLFPEWKFAPVELIVRVNATDIRKAYFAGDFEKAWGNVPWATYKELDRFRTTNLFTELRNLEVK